MANPLNDLNSEQLEAVTSTEGPLLIIAGAGTGKTKVLTHRILHLIESGKAKPEEILALTFTEKATLEMQERLDVLLPYGYTELWVKTFHGFCDTVLKESGLALGIDTGYQLLTPIDLALFLNKHLFQFELDIYRPLGNPSRFITALIEHVGHLREEMIEPEDYLKHAHKKLSDASEESAEHDEALKTLELGKAYQKYDDLLMTEGVLDFASLHHLTLKLFKNHPDILQRYQTQFKFILVDEFQDTNTAQNLLVEQLAALHENLMVVGDDDQSIYKWRGASLENILHFEKRFPTCKKVVLTQNYRSTQSILDMAYAVIQNNNPERLEAQSGIDKKLKSHKSQQNEFAKNDQRPSIQHFPHYLEEVKFVSESIQTLHEKEDVDYKEMAILVRAGAHAIPFIEALKQMGIPYSFSGSQSLFQREEIKDLFAVLRTIVNPSDDIAVFRCLSMSVFKLEMDRILDLLNQAKKTSQNLYEILKKEEKSPDLFSEKDESKGISGFLKLFHALQTMSRKEATSVILGQFLKESGYLKELEKTPSSESLQKIQSIASFSQIIKAFEEINQAQGVAECLEHLKTRMEFGDIPIAQEMNMENDTVKIFTIHAAKGLEFDTVFMVNLVEHRFPAINRRAAFEIPGELLRKAEMEGATLAPILEERRLFYVAATRAKKKLYLTYSDRYEGNKAWKPSTFIKEAIQSHTCDQDEKSLPVIPLATSSEPGESPLLWTYPRQHRSLKLSFSQIQTFEMCPLKYKFRYLYHLPEPVSSGASFGSSIHDTLNAFYQSLLQGEKPSLALLRQHFESHWIRMGYKSRAHHDEARNSGFKMLQIFFEQNSNPWTLPKYLEKPFTLKTPSGLTLTGRIDRIDRLEDGSYEVIDYKTGALKDVKEVNKDLQLSIYALACKKVFNIPVKKLSLYFLADQKKISTERSEADLNKTESELEEIAKTMATSSFEATPSLMVCRSCEYRLICEKAM